MAGEVWKCTAEEYYSDFEYLTNSHLSVFIRSPELYRKMVNGEWKQEASPQMDFGRKLHAIVLEGQKFVGMPEGMEKPPEEWLLVPPNNIMRIPFDVLSKSGAKAGGAWKEFEAKNPGKLLLRPSEYGIWERWHGFWQEHNGALILTNEELVAVKAIVANLRHNPVAHNLLWGQHGLNEVAVRWNDCVPRKCRIDRLGVGMIVDLKTTKDTTAKAFANSVLKFGYHRQAVWYRQGVAALENQHWPFVFVCCQTEEPYAVEIFNLSDDFLEHGRMEIESALERLAECQESDRFLSPTFGIVQQLELPRWALSQWEV